jgi:predicted metalloprotease
MDLSGQRESGNVEDARGGGGKQKLAIGGGIVALLITLVAGYFGIDPRLAQQLAGGFQQQNQVEDGKGVEDGYDTFSRKVLGSTEDVWEKQFQKEYRKKYKPAGMKLFSDQVDSEGCGVAPSAVGPFYCPRSQKVFLDPTFFAELKGKLGGSDGQFSQAYVIAHEVGHHVQNLLGYSDMLDGPEYKREGANAGIRLELQADYLAGVWAHHAAEKLKLTERDVKEAITTAQAIGDNRIQKKSQGWVSPEKFTHGTDEQRTRWFLEGMKSGDASERALMRFFNRSKSPREL